MKNALTKDLIRDIKNSKGRFLSILCIVALGVAFFSGIKISPTVMKTTSDNYYDDYNLMDIKILSTLGLTDSDVDKIRNIENVEGVFPTYSTDVLTTYNSQKSVLKVHALPLDDIKENNSDYINQVKVVEGRLPEKSGEAVIGYSKMGDMDIPLGETITLESGTENPLSDSLNTVEYTIVGKIETPYYLSYEKGNASIGSGNVDEIIMIPQEDFNLEVYTEMFITVNGAKKESSYEDEYFELVDEVSKEIENISEGQIELRHKEILDTANTELESGKKELEENKLKAETDISNAENEINTGEKQLEDGKKELNSQKNLFESEIESGKLKIQEAESELNKSEEEYIENLNAFNEIKESAKHEINTAKDALDKASLYVQDLENKVRELENKLLDEGLTEEEKVQISKELEASKVILNQAKTELEKGEKELEAKVSELNQAQEELDKAGTLISTSKNSLEVEKQNLVSLENSTKEEFEKAEALLVEKENELQAGKRELEEAKLEAADEISKAEKEIKDAEDEIEKIEKPEWYILDRESHYSYVDYKSAADSIDALAKIFPVFFFSVAALVCLTTMTRMVDEQRINIGTLKALGYTTFDIAKKYIIYAGIATILGSGVGLMIGYTVFPIVVFNAYGIMYTLPSQILVFDVVLAVSVTLVSVLITTLVTYSACSKELKETPSVLMRPKAPKNGKRILLERVPFIWNKVGFIGKVTIRNIFRYKKRFFMTVLGISGCTALILAGLGIQDSIEMIVSGQFGSIFKYDMTVVLDNEISISNTENINKILNDNNNIKSHTIISEQNGKLTNDKTEKYVSIIVPSNEKDFRKYIDLHDRKTQEDINLNNSGIIVSEKVARELDVKVGDKITLINSNDKRVEVKITGITENYLSHYVYMTNELYNELYNRDATYNRMLGILNDGANENKLTDEITNADDVSGIHFNTTDKEEFNNTIKSLNYVVLIMTVSAGALAFVVLYNLTNVNISERIREIATIKVLGFYDNEVSSYIYRENIILTVIGTIVGLGVGEVLHKFIMITVEIENMMFGRIVNMESYLIAAVLTLVLGGIVNFAMYYKLKNVKMVESLKSVD